ncbi:plasmid partitioning protein RepB [Rhizobium leguminosarum bv. trifolii WSM2297]|uniref:Plasmid partitioning protein RepB n=1 Tax=Rhizobium leguminosarum bv. trifolii WSM2297 TaxID=754762 RepID=J0WDP7_RHILT|nr:plasmid partitioning protein RepB [Rhizobium leguminosarum]EJC83966.1 plasmid partitioning protein RepB [Rhizobium leguminosarum bv. trifolii WSM2297]EJC84443.1 plasmid partitioning protein RepB [Rhizobium leguminosarum bv. trifolii WSM2297]
MARKNLLSGLMDDSKKFTAVNNEDEPLQRDEKHQITYKGIGALGAVTRSIDALAAKADAAKAIEEKLATGETVIDLDPALIEDSFVTDRLAHADEQFRELVEAIRLRGQDSPILVRPHPDKDGRYQIAFGHRRARAAKELGRPVRAIVKKLDDRDHVIAQGQENSARADLSFIERTMFADKLDTLGFDRETIMSALSADKTTVSKMLSVTRRIPAEVLAAIGAAKTTGRDRWHDLSVKFETENISARAIEFSRSAEFETAEPDARFDMLVAFISRRQQPTSSTATRQPAAHVWQRKDGAVKAKIKDDGKQFTIALKAERASAFGAYIASNLDHLYEAFEKTQDLTKDGDQ